jgi:competence protein ComEC
MFKTLTDFFVYRYKIKVAPYLKWYILFFVFIVSVASFFVPADIFNRDLKVYFLDIGQGDAALVRAPTGENILIDGGPDNSIVYKLGKYLPFWERKIDLMILTHPHADHLVGLVEVLKRYKVERIVFTGVSYYSDFYREFKKLREEKQIPFTLALAGRKFIFGKAEIEILYPLENLWNKNFTGEESEAGGLNDTSIVNRLDFGNVSFLFTGDAGVEVENKLKSDNLNLKSDILKVGHHGSDTASTYEFLKAVSPQLAVISVGKNNYGLPTYRILYRLRNLGIPFLRTDENGDIKVVCGLEKCYIE